jgi:hypothetical protein
MIRNPTRPGPLVVVATKGRAAETFVLLSALADQTLPPEAVVVVGAEASDIAGLPLHRLVKTGVAQLVLAARAGLTLQRNLGLDTLQLGTRSGDGFVAFFDDDFRPAPEWLATCAAVLDEDPSVIGVTGRVLADGVRGPGLSEEAAQAYLSGVTAPEPHWSNLAQPRDVSSLYGCNMAFRVGVCRALRFDEAIPLYGWQEDCDYTGQARRLGRTIVAPQCVGVHLGAKGGRTSGVRFGYSQIANPLHIAARRNMTARRAAEFVARALAANVLRSVRRHPLFDYRGRLRGNLHALFDLARGRCHPQRVLSLS